MATRKTASQKKKPKKKEEPVAEEPSPVAEGEQKETDERPEPTNFYVRGTFEADEMTFDEMDRFFCDIADAMGR